MSAARSGATCSIVTSYLMEQNIGVPPRIATGLLYGIETELSGYPREASDLDDERTAVPVPAGRQGLAGAHPQRSPAAKSHFECILHALQSSFIYDRLIISWVNELPQPELAAEVADFLIRFEEIDWAVCAGVYEDKLILSVRAVSADAQAGEMLKQVVGKLGRAGGHDRRAGGTIYLPSTSANAVEQMQGELRVGCSRRCTSTSAAVSVWYRARRCCRICSREIVLAASAAWDR